MVEHLKAKKNTGCRYCSSPHLLQFLSLGDQPLADSFIAEKDIPSEVRYPLDVYFCEDCFLTQLIDVVPKEVMFTDYLYLSSSSRALKEHYKETAAILTDRFKLKKGDVVLDIGCNDGILLSAYEKEGIVRIGVEPSNVAELAKKAGFSVYQSFFDKATTEKIVKDFGTVSVATTTNVFAHIDEIGDFVDALLPVLGNDGVFVIEAPYLVDMIEKKLFDTIYHEHLSYISLTPLDRFLKSHGLTIFDVERIPVGASGPALRIYIKPSISKREISSHVSELLSFEKKWGIGKKDTYLKFAKEVEKVKKEVLKKIKEIKKSGATLGGYGAPAKGNTLLNYFGITPKMLSCIADTSPVKVGLLTPGTHIPIVSEEAFLQRMPAYALLLTWNYLDFFLEKSEYIKKGGKFLVPLPSPTIVP